MKNKKSILNAFGVAFKGIKYCVVNERNIKIHIVAGLLVLILGWYLGVSSLEWGILILTITLVISLEMVNTAIETVVDMLTTKYHPLAKVAKDVAAGAVLVAALGSLVIGAVIFFKYFSRIFLN